MILDFGIQQAQDQDRADRIRHAENSGRTAFSAVTFDTSGVGSLILNQLVVFDTTFIRKPSVSTGIELVKEPDRTLHELPHATSGIYRWEKDERGYYVGAYVWVRVTCDPVLDQNGQVADPEAVALNPPVPKLRHHLVVEGLAYKKLPEDLTADLAAEL